jgi:hypothetical protein
MLMRADNAHRGLTETEQIRRLHPCLKMCAEVAEVVKLVDAVDSKSTGVHSPWGFDSPPRHDK